MLLHLRSFCKNFVCAYHTLAHKSGAFALSFGVTLAPIYSQLFLRQRLVFDTPCKKFGIRGSVFESLPFLNLKPSYKIPGFPRFVLKCSILKIKTLNVNMTE